MRGFEHALTSLLPALLKLFWCSTRVLDKEPLLDLVLVLVRKDVAPDELANGPAGFFNNRIRNPVMIEERVHLHMNLRCFVPKPVEATLCDSWTASARAAHAKLLSCF